MSCIIRNVNVQPLKGAHATQNIDKVRILNSIAFSRLGTCDFEFLQSYPTGDPNFQRVDEALASHFALCSWYGFVLQGRCTELLARAIKADVGRKIVQLSLTGCRNFSDHELDVLIQSLPAELRVLRLDLGFSGLETLDMFTSSVQCLKSLVQLNLRFTKRATLKEGFGSAHQAHGQRNSGTQSVKAALSFYQHLPLQLWPGVQVQYIFLDGQIRTSWLKQNANEELHLLAGNWDPQWGTTANAQSRKFQDEKEQCCSESELCQYSR